MAASLLLLAGCARAPIERAPPTNVTAAAAETVPPPIEPAIVRVKLPRFEMTPGVTLRDTLERWAQASGWTVRWASDRTYPIKGRATFEGDFVQAAGDLIRSFRQLNPPPIARFYLRNKELRVVTPGDEMGE